MPYKDYFKQLAYLKRWRLSHPDYMATETRQNKLRYSAEGKCLTCSAPLVNGEARYCVNCSTRTHTKGVLREVNY